MSGRACLLCVSSMRGTCDGRDGPDAAPHTLPSEHTLFTMFMHNPHAMTSPLSASPLTLKCIPARFHISKLPSVCWNITTRTWQDGMYTLNAHMHRDPGKKYDDSHTTRFLSFLNCTIIGFVLERRYLPPGLRRETCISGGKNDFYFVGCQQHHSIRQKLAKEVFGESDASSHLPRLLDTMACRGP